MFKAIRDFFRKTCRDCEHYSWYRKDDQLLPDKTVIKGKIVCESCDKMDCKLNDLSPCKLFRERSRTHNSFHAFAVYHNQEWPPLPPKGSSNVKRPSRDGP